MRRVVNVRALPACRLEVTFDDGVHGIVDVSSLVGDGVFAIWNEPRRFECVRIGSSGELCWGDEADLCPDALYLQLTGKQPGDIFPSLRDPASHA